MKARKPNIGCTHEDIIPATCTEAAYCRVCGLVDEGSEPLDHEIVVDEAVAPTCTQPGLAEGSHCSRCDDMTVAQTAVSALGHKHDSVCDETCNTCQTERAVPAHVDTDENHACDECGAELPKEGISGGAIAGIAVGSTAVAGLGGFSLFWFVIKKKKLSDLLGLIKK